MGSVESILDGNNMYGIEFSLVRPEIERRILNEERSLKEHIGFIYVLEGDVFADAESHCEHLSRHTTCVIGGGLKYGVRRKQKSAALNIDMAVPLIHVLSFLDHEHILINQKAKSLLSRKSEPFLYTAPASVTAQLLSRQILDCSFAGPMRKAYLELKAMELALELLSLHFVQDSNRADAGSLHGKVAKAWQMMCDNIEQPFSIPQVAKSVGMSESSLKRAFRAVYGDSIFSSFQRHRMCTARKLLEEGNCSVKDVAYRVGYTNSSHFSRAFSRYFGFPPKKCR